MHVALLTPGPRTSYITGQLVKHLALREYPYTLLRPSQTSVLTSPGMIQIFDSKNHPVQVDVVVNGCPKETGTEILEAFAATGIPVLNPPAATRLARNKVLTGIHLSHVGLANPASLSTSSKELVQEVFQLPIIRKPQEGRFGEEVFCVEDWSKLHEEEHLLVQEYIENLGEYIRVIVLGSRALGAHYCQAKPQTMPKDASSSPRSGECPLTPGLSALAVGATQALGLDLAGLDIIEGKRGWKIIEVNSWPNCKIFDRICGLSIGELLVEHLLSMKQVAPL